MTPRPLSAAPSYSLQIKTVSCREIFLLPWHLSVVPHACGPLPPAHRWSGSTIAQKPVINPDRNDKGAAVRSLQSLCRREEKRCPSI